MSNQEPQNPNKTTEDAAVENRRRIIKGVGVAVPVILTLSSPSVFGNGFGCLSQQMSGNASRNPGTCVQGNNATYWRDTPAAWATSTYIYGTKGSGTLTPACKNYSGGSLFKDVFGGTSSTALRGYLCSSLTSSQSTFVTALLNSVTISGYILTKDQVIAMWNGGVDGGSFPPPSDYANTIAGKTAFLKTTWVGT